MPLAAAIPPLASAFRVGRGRARKAPRLETRGAKHTYWKWMYLSLSLSGFCVLDRQTEKREERERL